MIKKIDKKPENKMIKASKEYMPAQSEQSSEIFS